MLKVFEHYAPRYHELGIPVIPLNGKVPLVSDWQAWSERAQTEDELEWLVERFPSANIGAVMGLWATALDIDTDNAAVLAAVPYSPIKRRGAKGMVAIYRKCDLPNRAGVDHPIELLNHGRQIVLPPSVHPETQLPYEWIGDDDIFHYPLSQLPPITADHLNLLERLCQREGLRRERRAPTRDGDVPVCLADPGRNNRLSRIAYAMACDGLEVQEAVERLLYLDEREHATHPNGPWFTDHKEPHKGKSPRLAAERMYARALRASKKRGDKNSELIIISTNSEPPSQSNDHSGSLSPRGPQAGNTLAQRSPPEPRGFMRLFRDYCNEISVGNQDALGLGGAISLMAALASNRFRTQAGSYDVWPNLYCINLAHSGFGKETPQRAIDELLLNTDLLGAASYKSGSSIVMNLPKQPERLDLIDECAMLLKAMCSQEDYKSEIVDVLSSLYSKASSRFIGFASRADGPRFGACWNPCVNILGSTTPQGFRGSVSKDMAAKGLMPRFLVFWQQDVGAFKVPGTRASGLLSELRRMTNLFLSHDKREHPDSRQPNLLNPEAEHEVRYDPELIPMTKGAQNAWIELYRTYYEQGRRDPESFESAFKNRFAQHVAKLALLDALSSGFAEIGVDSIEWAHDVVVWQWETVRELYELASAENPHEKDVLRVTQFIKSKGVVSQREITRKFQGIWSGKLDGILKQLTDGGMIERGVDANPDKRGPKPILYRYIST